ncbi:MAG: HAD family hydrolase [Thermodesulfobacteriota bacterium]
MEKELFVFDLDGTLIDSSGDIANAANRTLKSLGHGLMDKEDIKEKIGWGVNMLIQTLMPDEDAAVHLTARSKFLAYYGEHLLGETCLYEGVFETLTHFKKSGKKLAILTNKPEGLSRRIINALDLEGFFINITGGDTFATRKPDPAALRYIMGEAGVAPVDTVLVGDSPIDCATGAAAGVFTVGVSYGFRPVKELKEANCDMIIDNFTALREIFL